MLDFGNTEGHSNRFRFDDDDTIDAPEWYMFACFYEYQALGTGNLFLFGDGSSAGGDDGYYIGQSAGEELRVRHRATSGNTNAVTTATYWEVDSTVHSLFVAFDTNGNFVRIYKDGDLVEEIAFNGDISGNANGPRFGASQNGSGIAVRAGQFMLWTSSDADIPFSKSQIDNFAGTFHAGLNIPAQAYLKYWIIGDDATTIINEANGEEATKDNTITFSADDVDAYFSGETFTPEYREVPSRDLRRNRFAAPIHSATVTGKANAWELGDGINYSNFGIPRAESLIKSRETDGMLSVGSPVYCFLSGISINPTTRDCTLQLEELEHYVTTFWSTLKLPRSIDDGTKDGLAQLDLGASKSFTNNDVVWLRQADGLIARVPIGGEAMNYEGAWVFRASNVVSNSNFHDTSITTSWNDQSGDGSGAADTTQLPWKDTTENPRCLKLTKGTGDTYWEQTGIDPIFESLGDFSRVHILYDTQLNANGGTVSWALQRSNDSDWWDDTDEAWEATKVWNSLPQSGTQWADAYSKPIPFEITGSQTWTLHIGIASGSQNDTVRIGNVGVHDGETITPHIVTDSSADTLGGIPSAFGNLNYEITSDANRSLVYHKRHTVRVTFLAKQDEADLLDDKKYTIFACKYDASTEDNWVTGYYERPAGGSARFVYEIKRSGSIDATATHAIDIVSGTSYELAFRLTDDSGTELGLPARTASVLVDGVRGTDAQLGGDIDASENYSRLYIGRHFNSSYDLCENVIADLDIQQRAIPDEEIQAMR